MVSVICSTSQIVTDMAETPVIPGAVDMKSVVVALTQGEHTLPTDIYICDRVLLKHLLALITDG